MSAVDVSSPANAKSTLAGSPGSWWIKQLLVRLAFYVVGLTVLGRIIEIGDFWLTALGAMGVGLGGIALHRLRFVRDKSEATNSGLAVKVLVWSLFIEIGIGICLYQHWLVFSVSGFFGLSMLAFGIGQLAAEIRAASDMCGTVALLCWLNCVGAMGLALVLGRGGWLVLVVGIALLYPAVSFGTEFLLDRMDRAVKPWQLGRHGALFGLGGVLIVVGTVLLHSIGGTRFAVLIGGAILLLVAMISSNTDSDLMLGLFLLAVIGSQISPDAAALTPATVSSPDALLVIGDSYISGEGANDYFADTNTRDPDTYNECRRSTQAWAMLIAERRNVQVDFLACSGAKTINIIDHGQYVGENPNDEYVESSPGGTRDHIMSQIERYHALNREPIAKWVFLSIGGNDAGFGDLVQDCIAPGDCSLGGQRRLDQLTEVLQPRLEDLYSRLVPALFGASASEEEYGSRIVIVPYPVPISDHRCSIFSATFTAREFRFLNGFTKAMDDVIERAASRHHFRVVSQMPEVFEKAGTRICDTDASNASVNYFALNPVGGDIDPTSWLHNSMHPKEAGHRLMAHVIEQWLDHPEDPAGSKDAVKTVNLSDIMCGTDRTCIDHATSVANSAGKATPFEGTRLAGLHHLPGFAALVGGSWMISVATLHRRRRARKRAGPDKHSAFGKWLDDASMARRGVTLFGVIVGAIIVLRGAAWLIDLSHGYGPAQNDSAADLKARAPELWNRFYEMAWRDIVVYVPLYIAFGIVVILATRSSRPDGRHFILKRSWLLAMLALLTAGAADFVETLLFQGSLRRLRQAGEDANIDGIASATGAFTTAKGIAGIAALVFVVVMILWRPKKVSSHAPVGMDGSPAPTPSLADAEPELPIAVNDHDRETVDTVETNAGSAMEATIEPNPE